MSRKLRFGAIAIALVGGAVALPAQLSAVTTKDYKFGCGADCEYSCCYANGHSCECTCNAEGFGVCHCDIT